MFRSVSFSNTEQGHTSLVLAKKRFKNNFKLKWTQDLGPEVTEAEISWDFFFWRLVVALTYRGINENPASHYRVMTTPGRGFGFASLFPILGVMYLFWREMVNEHVKYLMSRSRNQGKEVKFSLEDSLVPSHTIATTELTFAKNKVLHTFRPKNGEFQPIFW